MKVAIRVDSSSYIGLGHLMRCLTLANSLKRYGHKIHFICRELPGDRISLVREYGHGVEVLPFYNKTGVCSSSPNNDETSNWLGVSSDLDAEETIQALGGYCYPWLIVDHYGIDASWHSLIRSHVQSILVIDDLANRAHVCDLLIDHNVRLDNQNVYKGLVPPHCEVLLGPHYALVSPKLMDIREKRLANQTNQKNSIHRVLIFMGGADLNNITYQICQNVLCSSLAQCHFDVVVSANNRKKEQVKHVCEKKPNFVYHEEPDNYHELLAEADLAIGAGGVSALERAIIGLYSIVLILAKNQSLFANNLAQLGCATLMHDVSEISSLNLNNLDLNNCNLIALDYKKPPINHIIEKYLNKAQYDVEC